MTRLAIPIAALALLLQACGTAPVTGRSQFLLVSEDQAIDRSAPAYLKMLSEPAGAGKLNNNEELNARVKEITERLLAQAIKVRPETRDWKWSMHIIDDPETINAWAMAGGKMALYTGLVEKIETTDDELAQVLGHEIAHALAKHTAEQMSRATATGLGLAILSAGTEDSGTVAGVAILAQLGLTLPHSRTAESEADRIGIELAARAGYDPAAAATLWEKMGKASGGGGPEWLSTHPSAKTRARTLRKLADEMRPLYEAAGDPPRFSYTSTPIPTE